MPRDRFFLWASIVMLAVVVLAFAPTYYFRTITGMPDVTGVPSLPWHLHVHGLAMTAWFLLPVVQTVLVAKGRTDLHRRLGIVGVGVALVWIPTAVLTVLRSLPRLKSIAGAALTGPNPNDLVIGDLTAALLLFPVMIGVALLRRNQPEVHKRWMFLSSVAIWGPVMGRFLGVWQVPALAIVFSPFTWIIALVVHDVRTLRRVHPATIAAGLFGLIGSGIPVLIARSPAGEAFVSWLGSLFYS